jgi:phosphoenolpyruvate-protein phosphotransferase (PTS system enzyme I)
MKLEERVLEGIPASPGIAIGRVHLHRPTAVATTHQPRTLAANEIEAEIARFESAVQKSRDQLGRIRTQMAQALDEKHAEIFTAQSVFLDDPDLVGSTVQAIRAERKNAEYLFSRRISDFTTHLSRVEDEFFRAREHDVLDIANRVLNNMSQRPVEEEAAASADSIVVSHELAPSEMNPLMKQRILGFVLEKGGPTSHTAIMAKALEIPAVVGVPLITDYANQGERIIVDGLNGRVILNPSSETLNGYMREQRTFLADERELDELQEQPAETIDGYSIVLRGNVELPEEVEHVAAHGARGIGLFRTEFLFMNRTTPPTQDEQFEIYKKVVEQVKPHSVVFRTLDFGGDKFFSNVPMAQELNPFMGQRAIRLCLNYPEIFQDQLRAVLRASAFGEVKVLIPMISGVEEFLEVKRHFKHAKSELRKAGIEYDPKINLGAMIEVPSAAVVADSLALECDFFSIGSNDLIQYTLAVDRGNEKVAYLYEPLHPAILRLLQSTVKAAEKAGIPVTVCGEIAADPMMAIILLGMGVRELSMSAVSVPQVKRLVRGIRHSEARILAEETLTQHTISGVKRIVRRRLKNYIKANKVRRSHLLRVLDETRH